MPEDSTTETVEMRAGRRLVAIAEALHRHDAHGPAHDVASLASALTNSSRTPTEAVAARDVALAVLGETTEWGVRRIDAVEKCTDEATARSLADRWVYGLPGVEVVRREGLGSEWVAVCGPGGAPLADVSVES